MKLYTSPRDNHDQRSRSRSRSQDHSQSPVHGIDASDGSNQILKIMAEDTSIGFWSLKRYFGTAGAVYNILKSEPGMADIIFENMDVNDESKIALLQSTNRLYEATSESYAACWVVSP